MSAFAGPGRSAAFLDEASVAAVALRRSMNGADIADKNIFRSFLPNPGAIFGLTMSTAGASNALAVAAGFAADSTNVKLMRLASSLAKTTGSFVLGAGGGLDASVVTINTWYHFYLIYNPTTDASDVIFSTNAVAPVLALAPGYTMYRRIGSAKTNGSSQWIKFIQIGDEFLWDASVNDVSNFTGTTAATTASISAPLGIRTKAKISAGFIAGTATTARGYIYTPGLNSAGLSGGGVATLSAGVTAPNSSQSWHPMELMTGLSSDIVIALDSPTASAFINTFGWIDTRGRLG